MGGTDDVEDVAHVQPVARRLLPVDVEVEADAPARLSSLVAARRVLRIDPIEATTGQGVGT